MEPTKASHPGILGLQNDKDLKIEDDTDPDINYKQNIELNPEFYFHYYPF